MNLLLVVAQLFVSDPADRRTYVTRTAVSLDTSFHKQIEEKFGYRDAYSVQPHVGGLLPRLPMAMAYSREEKTSSLFHHNGYLRTWTSLVVDVRGKLVLLDSPEKFRKTFAPITDEQEAMSYTAFLTHTEPRYDIERNLSFRNYVSSFPSAYAYRIRDGYLVLLHDKDFFGCGPHPYFYKKYKVTKKGVITELETVKMYEDPREDNICVD